MFGIPNVDSVTTSHFTYPAENHYLNSFQADTKEDHQPKKSTKHRNNNRPDPVVAGVKLISNSIPN